MRTSILLWSTLSGLILGLFIDATLIGVALFLSALVPAFALRPGHRWLTLLAIVLLITIPVVSAVLGFLEGRLKTN